MTGPRTWVAIADDDRVVRDALADLISSQPDLDLIGEAVDHPGAIRLAIQDRPEALVLDGRMPGGTAAETVRAIRDRAPHVAVLVLSAYGDPAGAVDVLSAGAAGYLVKGVNDREVLEAIARAVRGQLSMSAPLARECVELLRRHAPAPAAPVQTDPREVGEEPAEPIDAAERYQLLFDHSPEAAVVVDSGGRIRLVNAATERLFGYPREQLVGHTVDALLPEHPVTIYRRETDEVTAEPAGLELVGRRRDGTEFPIDLSVSRIPTLAGGQVLLTARDMTEIAGTRAVLEHSVEVLQATDQEHRGVLEDLVRAQERERMRIAAGIHDDSLQVITAASLRLQQLRRRLTDPDDLKALSRVEETIKLAADRLRRMIFDFRPPALEEDGLVTALQIYLDQLQEDVGTGYQLESQLDREPPPETRVVIYRIAQEALMNVRKHARASRVSVDLSSTEGGCLVQIVDDGVGYSPQREEARAGHLGLILMRDRAEIAGGWCRIESAPGAGTTVEFWVPFDLASARSRP
jgi:PAS domain S-box-containing protein